MSTGDPVRGADVALGVLSGFDDAGKPLVTLSGGDGGSGDGGALPALSVVALAAGNVGRQVALLFIGGDERRPLIIGIIRQMLEDAIEVTEAVAATDAQIDGERIVLSAEREIVLRCGDASITLTRAGKILIRGAYLSSRSTGVNRMTGGSIQIN